MPVSILHDKLDLAFCLVLKTNLSWRYVWSHRFGRRIALVMRYCKLTSQNRILHAHVQLPNVYYFEMLLI